MTAGPPGHVVIVGAGIAGMRTAETLRRERFGGRITLVGAETHPAYDRPALSKEFLGAVHETEKIYLRPVRRYRELDIDLRLGARATGLDLDGRRLSLDGAELGFDALVIATGSVPRQLSTWDGAKPLLLRTLDDAMRLCAALTGIGHLTVIGAGFIGSEIAAGARAQGVDVTVLELDQQPLSRAVGPDMGAVLVDLHRRHGTEVLLGVTALGPAGPGAVRLSDGSVLRTDLVVAGIGAAPDTGWLRDSGLRLGDGVECDETLRAHAVVHAVGDVANWPNPLFGRRMRWEHWTNASHQAAAVARDLARGTARPFSGANYVWSDQYGIRIQLVGDTTGACAEVVAGDPGRSDALIWYRDGDHVTGALAIGRPRDGLRSEALVKARTPWREALSAFRTWN